MIYRISIIINSALSLLFILLVSIGLLRAPKQESGTVIILVLICFSYGIFLLFDLMCHKARTHNLEKQTLPDWIRTYGRIIFGFTILALLLVLLMNLASTYALIEDRGKNAIQRKPFYIAMLFVLLISAVTTIINIVGYLKAVRSNKHILINYIDEIGSAS